MYKCVVCGKPSERGQALLRQYIYRPNGQIEREVPVCVTCNSLPAGEVELAVKGVQLAEKEKVKELGYEVEEATWEELT